MVSIPFADMFKKSEQLPLSVTELNSLLKPLIEGVADEFYVYGEVSNYSKASSGHIYFTLKDEESQIRCTLWKSYAYRLPFEIQNGMTLFCRGKIQLYLKGGSYNLSVTQIEPKGLGGLELAFRQLQEKLGKEGLFEEDRKKPVSSSPRRIAVVTSATGAALRDFLNILRRRSNRVDVLICPVPVQGDGASNEMVKTFEKLNLLQTKLHLDAIVLIRGGGSMEDLWAFNEENTVRAVASSLIPVVTGIGHEIDVSLSDLAADLHCLTPSDAATRLIPDDSAWPAQLDAFQLRLGNIIDRKIKDLRAFFERTASLPIFQSPADRLLGMKRLSVDQSEERLNRKSEEFVSKAKNALTTVAAKLEALSPLGVLARGYSITHDESGKTIRNASDLSRGQAFRTRLHSGEIVGTVTQIILSNRKEHE